MNPSIDVPEPVEVAVAKQSEGGPSVLFLGDTATADQAKVIAEKKGYTYPYAKTRALLKAYDAVVVNLEAPITAGDLPFFYRPATYRYKAAPAAAKALSQVGITAVSMANNHTKDYSNTGLADTLLNLDKNKIARFGAGMTEAEARRGIVLQTASLRIGLLGYMEDQRHWRFWNFAQDIGGLSWPGVARLTANDAEKDIARLKKSSDIVIAVVHWGKNYKPVTDSQKHLAKLLIDLGVDAIVGHHAHQAQPIGMYKGRPIIYSLGNFAFDTPGHRTMRFGMGAAFHFKDRAIDSIELIPILTQNRKIKFQPRIAKSTLLDDFFDFIIPASKEYGAKISRSGDRGWLDF